MRNHALAGLVIVGLSAVLWMRPPASAQPAMAAVQWEFGYFEDQSPNAPNAANTRIELRSATEVLVNEKIFQSAAREEAKRDDRYSIAALNAASAAGWEVVGVVSRDKEMGHGPRYLLRRVVR